MIFLTAVQATAVLNDGLKPALQALVHNQSYVRLHHDVKASGSVDIDDCLQLTLPNDPRWDYVFGIYWQNKSEKIFYVEIHRATVNEVNRIEEKFYWLLNWLNEHSPLIEHLDISEFYWLAAGSVKIPPNAPEIKKLAAMGIELKASMDIY